MNNNYYTIEPLQSNAYSLWQPFDTTHKILIDSNINSNWKYRQYAQNNAKQIMKFNTMQTINDSGNNPYTILNTTSSDNSPHLYNSIHDNNNPSYGFRNSDLKQDYMKKQQMKAKMVAPSISTNFKF